jgi:predicted transcriptional regulator
MSSAASDILGLTASIVAAHVSGNEVKSELLPLLIQKVYRSLATAGDAGSVAYSSTAAPACVVDKSVSFDFIVCLEDGRKLKTLKRHLMTHNNLTPQAYRTKWGLPPDYPLVAPAYTQYRSCHAKRIGLGRKSEPVTTRLPARRAKGYRG